MYCFILYTTLALLIRPCLGKTTPSEPESQEIEIPVESKSLKNAAEIVQLLKIMNKNNFKNKLQRKNSELTGIDTDYLGVSTEKDDIINGLMELIKKNYSNSKNKRMAFPKDRLLFISNPEVLEEYKKQQKAKQSATSSEGEGEAVDMNLMDVLSHLRRSPLLSYQNIDGDKEEKDEKGDKVEKEDKAEKEEDKEENENREEKDNVKEEAEEGLSLPHNVNNAASLENPINTVIKINEHKISLRTGQSGHDDKFDSLEVPNDFEVKTTKFTLKDNKMTNSAENSWGKKKEDKKRFKEKERYYDDYSYNKIKERPQKQKPMASMKKKQDDVGYIPRPNSFVPQQNKVKGKRERESPGAYHPYGRTPVPIVGKRGIYEDD